MQTFVTVKTSFEGIHNFPEAPEEVKFLRQDHRHMFGVAAKVEVYSDDREIEFIMMKHRINDFLDMQKDVDGVWYMGRTSCEQVAEKIRYVLSEHYDVGNRQYEITVDEDGENGATIVGTFDECVKGICDEDEDDEVPHRRAQCKKKTLSQDCSHLSLANYQKMSYRAIQEHADNKEEVMHWAIGLGEEAGEALSVIKHRYYGGSFDIMDLVNELGDTLWYIAALCTANGISMEDVAHYNLAKMECRYPTEHFDFERSNSRERIEQEFKTTPIYEAFKTSIEKKANAEAQVQEDKEDEEL